MSKKKQWSHFGPFGDQDEQLARLLEVDEVVTEQALDAIKLTVRIGSEWFSQTFNRSQIEDSKAGIGRLAFDLVREAKKRIAIRANVRMAFTGVMSVDEARSAIGLPPVEQEKRPTNRFEAIAEELKKMGEAK